MDWFKVKIGDLVQYKLFPDVFGVVVQNDNTGIVCIWFSYPDGYTDYIWEAEDELEVVCK